MPVTASATDSQQTCSIRSHVEMLHSLAKGVDGVLVVSVFHASPTGETDAPGTVTHHAIGDVDGMVEAIEAQREVPGANIYVGMQVMRRGLGRGKRGSEADIVAVLGLVADMDSDTGKGDGEYPLSPNLVVETSPGNAQPFWIFDRPLTPAIAKPLAKQLRVATGADHGTADICHVWRVPGTRNFPNRKKLDRGRSLEPASVTVAQEWDGSLTDPTELAVALSQFATHAKDSATIELGELPDIDGVVVTPEGAALLGANDVGDRSSHAARVVEKLAFDGHTAEVAAALFLSAHGDWLSRYASEDAARADFSRLWGKFGREPVQSSIAEAAAKLAGKLKPKAAASGTPPAAANDNRPSWPGIVSSGDLIASFTPPDYHIDGIVQASFLYSLTAPTGTGKTAILLKIAALTALGKPLGDREVRKGRVVYFAGENPADVTMRWIAEAHHTSFDGTAIDVHFVPGTFDIVGLFQEVAAATKKLGGVDLVIVDTSAAYFLGGDENANAEMGKHARALRTLTTLPGSPCVLVACHPTKNAAQDNLLPRGGGAFIAEVDGNLVAFRVGDSTVKLHWQGKHRGPDFEPVMFDLSTVTAPQLRDSKGRDIPTVMASVVSTGEARERKASARRDEDDVLLQIEKGEGQSLTSLAEALGWFGEEGTPQKRRVQSASEKLKRSKLVEFAPRIGWKLTKLGMAAVAEVRAQRHRDAASKEMVAGLVRKSRPWGDED